MNRILIAIIVGLLLILFQDTIGGQFKSQNAIVVQDIDGYCWTIRPVYLTMKSGPSVRFDQTRCRSGAWRDPVAPAKR
jgi:hypothetical protein